MIVSGILASGLAQRPFAAIDHAAEILILELPVPTKERVGRDDRCDVKGPDPKARPLESSEAVARYLLPQSD